MGAKNRKPNYSGNLFYIEGGHFDKNSFSEILDFSKEHFKYLEIIIEKETPVFKEIAERRLPAESYKYVNEDDSVFTGIIREIKTKEKDFFSESNITNILKSEDKWRFSGEKMHTFNNGRIYTNIIIEELEEAKRVPGTNTIKIEIPLVKRIISIFKEENRKEEKEFNGIYQAFVIAPYKNKITTKNLYKHYLKIKETP